MEDKYWESSLKLCESHPEQQMILSKDFHMYSSIQAMEKWKIELAYTI